jgi:subtilisin family serine protease
VRIAVIDTGIDAQHPDLFGRVVAGTDFSGVGTPDGTTPVGSAGHHGTMVASLISGQGEITGGIWGVAPEAELLSISIGLGVPDADTDAQVAAGIRWAVDAGEHLEGHHCLGAPIFGAEGNAIASLWITGPSQRLSEESMTKLAPGVKKAGAMVTAALNPALTKE